jgi:hypothetical protein
MKGKVAHVRGVEKCSESGVWEEIKSEESVTHRGKILREDTGYGSLV